MQIKYWFVDGHPQRYHIAALVLAMAAVSLALTAKSLAEEGSSSENTTGTATACSYDYSSWGDCQPGGKRYRTVEDVSPSGCMQTTAPVLVDSCSYTPPECNYSYSDWSSCQSSGKQYRTVTGYSPQGCASTTTPTLERSCTYTAPTTNTTSTTSSSDSSGTSSNSTSSTSCSYSYSSWSACQSEGKRYRSIVALSPAGCIQTTAPKLSETCTYTAPSSGTTSSITNSGSTSTTSLSSSGTTQCSYTYGSWSDCQSNSKRTRVLASKLPSGCMEYTKPVLEQSCIYENVTVSDGGGSMEGSTTVSSSFETTTITPTFSFRNVEDGATWKGVISIQGRVQGAEKVEYYLVQVGSNIFRYIGSGQPAGEGEWKLDFRSGEFPNGEFYLRAKIKNRYGEYGGGQRRIRIANGDEEDNIDALEEAKVAQEMEQKKKEALIQIAEGFNIQLKPEEKTLSLEEQKVRIFTHCETNPTLCFPERDGDQDGLSDIDEIRFGTDPKGADSDLDGFIDGDEVKNGFDPSKYSPGDQSDRIVFESPKVSGETKSHYAVKTVEMQSGETGKEKLRLSGKGLPNSFVTLYIYSDPIVLTVKTDSEGNWVYELDKELEDGEHEAYVAITDNTGKITGKSEPLAFVKTAQAVSVIPRVEAAPPANTLSVSENRSGRDLIFLISIIVGGIAIALAIIGLIKHRHNLNKEKIVIFPQS